MSTNEMKIFHVNEIPVLHLLTKDVFCALHGEVLRIVKMDAIDIAKSGVLGKVHIGIFHISWDRQFAQSSIQG